MIINNKMTGAPANGYYHTIDKTRYRESLDFDKT